MQSLDTETKTTDIETKSLIPETSDLAPASSSAPLSKNALKRAKKQALLLANRAIKKKQEKERRKENKRIRRRAEDGKINEMRAAGATEQEVKSVLEKMASVGRASAKRRRQCAEALLSTASSCHVLDATLFKKTPDFLPSLLGGS
jgi:hypothetical protein